MIQSFVHKCKENLQKFTSTLKASLGGHHDGLYVPEGGVGPLVHHEPRHLRVPVHGGLAERARGSVVLLLSESDLNCQGVDVSIVPW